MRTIMHVDLDAFFCAVEQRRNPALAGKAFVVAGRSDERGVVATASYAARAYGIKAGTPTARAQQLCRDIIVVRPRYPDYVAAAAEVMQVLQSETVLVEQASIDEAYVDLSGLTESPVRVARRVRARVHHELQLSLSCGIASNKLVAKAATDIGKQLARDGTMPQAIYAVPQGEEARFLAPLPVDTLCGIGPKTTQRLHALGITTLGEIGWTREADIRAAFSPRQANELIRWARGIDHTPLVFMRPPKSLSHETTFMRDTSDVLVVESTLLTLTYELARRLQRKQLRCYVVSCRIRWDMRESVARQARLVRASDQGDEIYARVHDLLHYLWDGKRAIRLVGVGVSQLGDYPAQLGLWDSLTSADAEQQAQRVIVAAEQFLGRPLSTHRLAQSATKRWTPADLTPEG